MPGRNDDTLAGLLSDMFDWCDELARSINRPLPEAIDARLAHIQRLSDLVSSLPEPRRTIVQMRFAGKQALARIAAQLGTSVQRAEELLEEALVEVRSALDAGPPRDGVR
jgi:DNA-directed RNA polymerase specialized sigma24 family protein